MRQTSDSFFFALLKNSLYGSRLAAFVFLVAAVAVKCEFSALMRQTREFLFEDSWTFLTAMGVT